MGRIQLYEVQVYNIVVDVVNHDGIPKVTGGSTTDQATMCFV